MGMRVHGRDLAAWSFLLATAHGAGLMLVPVLLRLPSGNAARAAHLDQVASGTQVQLASVAVPQLADVVPAGVRTFAMFVAMGLIAGIVYEKVGLAILRRA